MTTATVQHQARALGNETRYRIYQFLAEADEPVDVTGLVDEFGLTYNAIRRHLRILEDVGLVLQTRESRTAPGRPRQLYHIAPGAMGEWGARSGCELLSLLLLDMLRSGENPEAVGLRAGRRLRLGGGPSHDPLGDVVAELEHDGFDPLVVAGDAETDIVFRQCPYLSAALAAPDIVCKLHLGRVRGLIEVCGGVRMVGLSVRDPREGACTLRVIVGDVGDIEDARGR